jgi:PST family polysaccharide transporter
MRPVLKAAGASSTAAVVSALAGAVRVKVYAVFLGPAGIGVASQVQTVANTLQVLASLGVGVGVTREVARARGSGDEERAAAVVSTARGLGVALAIALALLLAALARPLSAFLIGDPRYALLLLLAAPALPCGTLGRVLGEAVSGLRDYVLSAKAGIVGSLLALAIPGILVWRFGLPGAAASIPVVTFLSWLVLRRLVRAAHPWLARSGFTVRRDVAPTLMRVGAASLVLSLADQLVLLTVRARLIAREGASGNGLFQGVWGLSQTSLNVAVAFLMSYSFARVQESAAQEDRIRETNHALRTTLLLMAPVTAVMILGRFVLIEVFLSPAFRPAAPLFVWQASGDFLHAAGRALGVGVLAFASVRAWLLLGLLGSGSFLVAFLLILERAGLLAGPQAWLLSGFLYLLATHVLVRRAIGFRLYPRGRVLAWASSFLVAGTAAVADGSPRSYAIGALLLLGWTAAAVRPSDVREVLAALSRRLGGR